MPRTSNRNAVQQNAAQENAVGNSMAQLAMEAVIVEHNPERGVLASADVKVGDIMTVRNVRIREDDYGLTVSMPRTKMPHTDQYKDSVFFFRQESERAVRPDRAESLSGQHPFAGLK